MTEQEFLVEFIEHCTNNNISTPKEMCNLARIDIKKIDEELDKIKDLKIKQRNLKAAIETLSNQKYSSNAVATIDFSIPADKLDVIYYNMCIDICKFIDEKSEPVTPSEIMENISNITEHKIVYSSIRWLLEHNIVSRVDNSLRREIIKGVQWNNRPLTMKTE